MNAIHPTTTFTSATLSPNKVATFMGLIMLSILLPLISYGQPNVNFKPIPNSYGINSPNPVFALNISYDNIDPSRQAFHIFLPDTQGAFPLVIYIHGGGFIGGSRDGILTDTKLQRHLKYFLENGIAFASVGYRLIKRNSPDNEGVIKSLSDAKRALQYIRHFSSDLKIKPNRIALSGGSAGAGTSLWLATRSNMADPSSPDPVLRESTRVRAVQLGGSQATYDIPKWENVVYADFGTTLEDMEALLGFDRLSNFYGGLNSIDQLFTDPNLIQYRQDVDMLYHMSSDDPPIYINSGSRAPLPSQDLFHHHAQSLAIQTHAIAANVIEVKANIKFLNIDTTEGESGDGFLARYLKAAPSAKNSNMVDINNQWSIYPNPTISKVYIQSDLPNPAYAVYSLHGKLILKGEGKEVNVTAIPCGTYLIKHHAGILKFRKQ